MASPERRSAAARIAVNVSWARTPDRRERTRAATQASPVSIEFWEAKLREERVVREEDISLAAENARKAYMAQLAIKSAQSRARNKAAKRQAVRQAASA